jgi:hypothetical protein
VFVSPTQRLQIFYIVVVAFCIFKCFGGRLCFQISPCEALVSELKFALNCSNANKPVRRRLEQEDDDDEEEDTMPAGVTAGSFARIGFEKLTQAE